MSNPLRYFKTSPEIIRLAVMMYIRVPLPLRKAEGLLHERGTDITHETVRYWRNRCGQPTPLPKTSATPPLRSGASCWRPELAWRDFGDRFAFV